MDWGNQSTLIDKQSILMQNAVNQYKSKSNSINSGELQIFTHTADELRTTAKININILNYTTVYR